MGQSHLILGGEKVSDLTKRARVGDRVPRLSETIIKSKKLTDLQKGRTLALQRCSLSPSSGAEPGPSGESTTRERKARSLGTASEHEAHVHSGYRFILFVFYYITVI